MWISFKNRKTCAQDLICAQCFRRFWHCSSCSHADYPVFPVRILRLLEGVIVYHPDHCFLHDSLINAGVKMIDHPKICCTLSDNVRELHSRLSYHFPTYIRHLIVIKAIIDLVRALDGQHVGKQEIGYPLLVRSTRGTGVRAQGREQSRFPSTG